MEGETKIVELVYKNERAKDKVAKGKRPPSISERLKDNDREVNHGLEEPSALLESASDAPSMHHNPNISVFIVYNYAILSRSAVCAVIRVSLLLFGKGI